MTFGKKLQKLRKNQRMSQEELASKITVSRQAVSKWELDETMPDVDNIIQLSKIFGISIDYLLDDEINIVEEIPIVKETTKKLKKKYYNFGSILLVISIILAIIIGNLLNLQATVILGIICFGILVVIVLLINFLKK
ncbi:MULTISPECIES: helix-turn-helix domain-containing protein [unclassified Sedimentibacter]|uniref:helix-turn-helix domain-containing protein n=1 Tax=unclassified Sedimentibacter TaxID=2649220 RepID=UPI0027DFE2FB|nr:helix-turn-helix transcriptional regulator [Sedimentibacter sp. MB35-C1]WMJ76001.1 helix-turn-helix transcriptional regulator [Sedimentibacter sp. MB35-C1]